MKKKVQNQDFLKPDSLKFVYLLKKLLKSELEVQENKEVTKMDKKVSETKPDFSDSSKASFEET